MFRLYEIWILRSCCLVTAHFRIQEVFMNEHSGLESIKGIGEKTKKIFERAGVFDVGDLLHYYPRHYDTCEHIKNIAEVSEGETAAVCASLSREITVRHVKRMSIAAVPLRDMSGTLQASWYNMPYLKNSLKPGKRYVFRGKVIRKGQQTVMEQPAVFDVETYAGMQGQMQPIYPLADGLTNKMVTKAVRQALDKSELSKDPLPKDMRIKWNLAEYHYALEQIHFPENEQAMRLARQRLVFDEFFMFILGLRSLKNDRVVLRPQYLLKKKSLTEQVISRLPYALTNAQKKVWQELEKDMTGESVCARLIQGDVGSGKTILAVLALFLTAANGYQGCLMVPTEVLARQHFESLTSLISEQELPFRVILLTGSMKAKEKREAYEAVSSGMADIIVGTHALIQEKVEYHKLALVITDEQHRFGVRQREALADKGMCPHTIVMSATPIPRTLAVILYGDLDISVIDELPANRLPIKNCVVGTSYRQKAYAFICREVEQGHQAYVICPMVEESEAVEAENVIEYTEQIRAALPGTVSVEYLHGKMKPALKNEIMERFLRNEIQVLVSTTVVEVGVNVPNATVMMIENAERFGLAQLHQLRGRVGRGKAQSYCIMVHGSDSKRTRQRLEILNQSNDGFFIAGEDLKLRGPGDLFGIRQSGMLEFRLGDVFQDAGILQQASEAASEILLRDETLSLPENRMLKERLSDYIRTDTGHLNL